VGTECRLSGLKVFSSCYTETGWGRLTITFDGSVSKEHLTAGHKIEGMRDIIALITRLMSTMWDKVLKIQNQFSVTNLRIGTEVGYTQDKFYAQVSQDMEGTIEYPTVGDFAYARLETIKETSLDITRHIARWVC
jgi:hypothetical protein